jgi:hypothetical protein
MATVEAHKVIVAPVDAKATEAHVFVGEEGSL